MSQYPQPTTELAKPGELAPETNLPEDGQEEGTSTRKLRAPKSEEDMTKHWRKLITFFKRADAAKQIVDVLPPTVSLEPKTKLKGDARSGSLQLTDFRTYTPGFINLSTKEEFLFPETDKTA